MVSIMGWVEIKESVKEPDDNQLANALASIRARVEDVNKQSRNINQELILRAMNGSHFLVLALNRARWSAEVNEFLRALRLAVAEAPGSRGVIYLRSDEGPIADARAYRVWVVRRGAIEERHDPFLSPVIPVCCDKDI